MSFEASLRPFAVEALRVFARGRTYLILLYHFLSLPLAIIYFAVLFLCAAIGAITAPIGIGILILIGGLIAARGFSMLERELAIALLGMELPPLAALPSGSPWARIRAHLGRAETWKALAYLMLKLPLGLFVYALAIPVLGPAILGILGLARTALPDRSIAGLFSSLIGAALGVAIVIAVVHGAILLARLWERVAAAMLGPSQDERIVWEAQRRAEAADRKRRELILNVSHELRTPIASIQGHLDSLLMPEAERPANIDPQQYLGVAAAETRRLGALVGELLDLARADASALPMSVRPVDIGPIAHRVALTLAPLAKHERQVTLVDADAEPGVVGLADPDRLTQVLTNLVRNAINHTPAGGAVRLQAGADDATHVFVAVSDTGSGIAAAELPHVFDRFFRTDSARSRDTGGFGLGLSIARDLVEAMGGTITATSELDVGSTFLVRLKRPGG
ncbi:MAG TPA: ATP-binding protein [Candidatus Limnocylindrales bacterium]|nr:ATP-binding protein [Candidatus Limnocylindrales bacterium]